MWLIHIHGAPATMYFTCNPIGEIIQKSVSQLRQHIYSRCWRTGINSNLDGYKKCAAVQLGVIYDSQPNNRKLGGLPARTLTPSSALLLVFWESYITPSQLEYTKMPPETGVFSYFLIEKSPKTTFFLTKTFNKI
jgi:hypothetical protein